MTDRVKPESLDPIPKEFARMDWAPVAYTTSEGGEWNRVADGAELPPNYSALQYRNGWIYDNVLRQLNVNPWRHVDDTYETPIEPDTDSQGDTES